MGDGRALGEGVAGDGFACGQHAVVEGELLLAADEELPVCHVAVHGKIGMPAVGNGNDAVAQVAHLAADVELAVCFQRVAHLNLVGKRIAAVVAAVNVGKGNAGVGGGAVAALQRKGRVKD